MSEIVRVARPPILDRIDPTRHIVIEASAGTGKTYTLEHLVLDLVVRREVPLERILVVTFTEKATREMRERLRATLRRVLDATDRGVDAEGPAWSIDGAARRRVADALAVFDRAPISTIHAFCQRILTENAFDCARLLRQEQVESKEAFGRAFREELRVALVDDEPLRPVIELAVATFGIGRVESSLHGWTAERGAPRPAFSRERAHAALRALPDRRDLGPGGSIARLLDAALSRNPKKEVPARLRALAPVVEAARRGAPLYAVLLDLWAWAQVEAPGKTNNLGYVRKYLGREPRLRPLAERFDELALSAGTPVGVLVAELLPRIVARLTGRKDERGHFDFDDMLTMLRDALFAGGGDALVSDLRRRYRYALVDEFQDTDRVQWDIFARIFFDHEGAEQRLVVIGDPKQAIYGFRNADVYTYHAARAAIVARGGDVVPLDVSYRSTAPFLEALDRVLAEGFFSGVNSYPHPVRCGRPELRAIEAGGDAAPITLLHLIGRPALRASWVLRALSAHVAMRIAQLLDGGLQIDRGEGPRPLAPSDVHVLCRSRADAEAVGAALTEARVPFAFYKQEGLFQTEAARHVWDVLRAIEAPEDRALRLRAWLTPFFAVPLERLADCRDLAPDHPLVARLREWRDLAQAQRFATLLRAMLDQSGLARRELFAARSERDLTDYQHVLEVLLEETHRGRRSLPQLTERLAAFIDQRELPLGESGNVQRLESERQAVQVLTMHKSKGLEAEVVFLVGGLAEPPDDRLRPRVFHDEAGDRIAWLGQPPDDVRARMEREDREEAERLLYVAMTRARSKLYLPYFGPLPPGAVLAGQASLGLEPDELAELRAQLSLLFDDPELAESAPADAQYDLSRMNGPYHVVNERLAALVSSGEAVLPRFAREEVVVAPPAREGARSPLSLSAWRPRAAPSRPGDEGRFARARRERGGFRITSYTAMKRAAGGYRAPDDMDDALGGAGEPDVALPAAPAELPGGSAVGVFLHEVLERLPFERARGERPLLDDPIVAEIIFARAAANGIERSHASAAAELVAAALRTPLVLADGASLPDGLAAVERRAVELPFLHPIPEASHAALGAPPPTPDDPPLSIERGFIRGVIDLVIEHEGRFHLVDYKSDRLPSYAADALAAHVAQNYLVQARLYALGALRVLSIHDAADYERRFGGLLYAFLRGMGEGQGVYVQRPSWDDVARWEQELLRDEPWGYPLPRRRRGSPPRPGE